KNLIIRGNNVYALGDNFHRMVFPCDDDAQLAYLTIIDKTNSQLLANWSYNHNAPVFDKGLLTDTIMYIQGRFMMIDSLPRMGFAAINLNDGSITPWNTPFVAFPDYDPGYFIQTSMQFRNGAIWFADNGFQVMSNGTNYHGLDAI